MAARGAGAGAQRVGSLHSPDRTMTHYPISKLELGSPLADHIRRAIRVSYALRRVPESSFHCLLPAPEPPSVGDVALARVESIGKNVALDLTTGRPSGLHGGDPISVAFRKR